MMASLRELLAFREVVFVLVWRDLKARYRGSVLGFLWTFLNPLLLMGIYSLVFSVYMRVDLPAYPIFVFSGLLPWLWFSSSMLSGSGAIVESGNLMKRVAFPPQVLPTVSVTATLVNFLLSLPLLWAFAVWAGLPLSPALAALPLLIVIQYVLTLGLTVAVSILTVRYRDLHQLMGNVMMLWFFLTPVLYPPAMVPERFRGVLLANPMAPIVMGYQSVIYRGLMPDWVGLALAGAAAVALLGAGLTLSARLRWKLVEEL